MATTRINALIDSEVKQAVEDFCRSRGVVMSNFVQEALVDRLEELEDAEDIDALRREPTRQLSEVLSELERDDEL